MAFYTSAFYNAKLRTDSDSNKAFIKFDSDGKEREIPIESTTVVDIMTARELISQAEYQASASSVA